MYTKATNQALNALQHPPNASTQNDSGWQHTVETPALRLQRVNSQLTLTPKDTQLTTKRCSGLPRRGNDLLNGQT